MNKATLVLEDGRVFKATVKGLDANKIGTVTLKNSIASMEHQGSETSFNIESGIRDFKNVKGKLVVDSLPVDYHLYDLKTAI